MSKIHGKTFPGPWTFYKNLVLSTELIMYIGHRTEILKADLSSVSPSSERSEELWVMCSFFIVE